MKGFDNADYLQKSEEILREADPLEGPEVVDHASEGECVKYSTSTGYKERAGYLTTFSNFISYIIVSCR